MVHVLNCPYSSSYITTAMHGTELAMLIRNVAHSLLHNDEFHHKRLKQLINFYFILIYRYLLLETTGFQKIRIFWRQQRVMTLFIYGLTNDISY